MIPVVMHLCSNTSSHCSADATNSDLVDDASQQSCIQPVQLPSSDPWTLYVDRSHSALIAVKLHSAEASDTHSQLTAKPVIDNCICSVSHKAKLWTVHFEPESAITCMKNYWDKKETSECKPAVKTLRQLADESSQNSSDWQCSDLKLRLAEVLGKHAQKRHAATCFLVFFMTTQSIYSLVDFLTVVIFDLLLFFLLLLSNFEAVSCTRIDIPSLWT